MLESLFNKFAEILLDERLHHRYFSMKTFHLKNTFFNSRSSRPEVFLEISQNLQENICATEPFLIKLQASGHLQTTASDTEKTEHSNFEF